MRPLPIIKGHRYFEAQEREEGVLLITRKHWLALTSPFMIGFVTAVILLVFANLMFDSGEKIFGDMDDTLVEAFRSLLILYIVLASFSTWLIRYLNVIVVTSKHLVDISQKAFFVRSVSTLALQDIEDISIDKNGLLPTVLDYGNLKIQTAGELPNFELKSIADPETIQREIMEAKAAVESGGSRRR